MIECHLDKFQIDFLFYQRCGHSVDKIRSQSGTYQDGIQSTQEVITVGVIILAAKLAKADGQVTADEVSAFKEKFQIPPNFQSDVGKIFNEAKKSSNDYHQYAQQLLSVLMIVIR